MLHDDSRENRWITKLGGGKKTIKITVVRLHPILTLI